MVRCYRIRCWRSVCVLPGISRIQSAATATGHRLVRKCDSGRSAADGGRSTVRSDCVFPRRRSRRGYRGLPPAIFRATFSRYQVTTSTPAALIRLLLSVNIPYAKAEVMNDEEWLDLETHELLQAEPPRTLAPATLPDYSLVLLQPGGDRDRMIRAVRRVNGCSDHEANNVLSGRVPLLVNADLSYEEALLGQFEFVCSQA